MEAVDFLIKPVHADRFKKAVNKATAYRDLLNAGQPANQIESYSGKCPCIMVQIISRTRKYSAEKLKVTIRVFAPVGKAVEPQLSDTIVQNRVNR